MPTPSKLSSEDYFAAYAKLENVRIGLLDLVTQTQAHIDVINAEIDLLTDHDSGLHENSIPGCPVCK
jgi:hypothetical protein